MATPEEFLKNFETFDVPTRQKMIADSVNSLPIDKKTETLISATKELSNENQQQVIQGLNPPDDRTTNFIWKIIVCSFAFILVGAFLSMAYSLFFPPKEMGEISDKLITIFSTTSAFLAGLLVPSPTGRK